MSDCKTQCPLFEGRCDIIDKRCFLSPKAVVLHRRDLVIPLPPSRVEKLATRDELRRNKRIARDLSRPNSVFARRRTRQRENRQAVGELVNAAFKLHGGTGDAGAVVI